MSIPTDQSSEDSEAEIQALMKSTGWSREAVEHMIGMHNDVIDLSSDDDPPPSVSHGP